MDRKGAELSTNTLIVAIIALVVLAIIIYVFRDNISRLAASFAGIGSEAGKQATNATGALGSLYK